MACTMANIWRGKNQRAFKISDFMLDFSPPEPLSPKKVKNVLTQFAAAWNAHFDRCES